MTHRNHLIGTSSAVVRIAFIVNRGFLLAVLAGLAVSLVWPHWLTTALLAGPRDDANLAAALTGIRVLLLIGIVMAVATDRLLAALRLLVASARAGDPFAAINARRLQTIGWCLLVLQLLDMPGLLFSRLFASLGSAAPGGGISIGGWVAVLMVFVLARVFATGAAMRDELAATV